MQILSSKAIVSIFPFLLLIFLFETLNFDHVSDTISLIRSNRQLTEETNKAKQSAIPQRLWLDVHIPTGKNHPKEKFEENLRNTVNMYKNAWGVDTIKFESLNAEICRDAITRIPLKGANTELLKYHMENDPQRHVCRIAVLFLYGGYFMQEEVQIIEPFIPQNEFISFAAVINPENELFNGLFLACAAHSPILYRALKKYILLAKGELQLTTMTRYGEILRSSLREVRAVNPGSKSNMVILSEGRLDDLQQQHYEYRQVKKQDGEGPFCNYVIVNHATKQTLFYTRFAGAEEHQCDATNRVVNEQHSTNNEQQSNNQQQAPSNQQQTSAIPHKLFFASRHPLGNMREGENSFYDNVLKTIKAYQLAWGVDRVDYKILNKEFCRNAIAKLPMTGASSTLLDYYSNEADVDQGRGFDICRAAVLFQEGGYMFNSEVEVIEPYAVVNNEKDFVGVKTSAGPFLSSFIASAPRHPITKFILMKYILLAETMSSPERSDQASEIYRDSFYDQTKEILSKSVLLQETHLSVIDGQYDKSPKRSHKCSFVIFDPESKKNYFYTRMFIDGEHCVDNK